MGHFLDANEPGMLAKNFTDTVKEKLRIKTWGYKTAVKVAAKVDSKIVNDESLIGLMGGEILNKLDSKPPYNGMSGLCCLVNNFSLKYRMHASDGEEIKSCWQKRKDRRVACPGVE